MSGLLCKANSVGLFGLLLAGTVFKAKIKWVDCCVGPILLAFLAFDWLNWLNCSRWNGLQGWDNWQKGLWPHLVHCHSASLYWYHTWNNIIYISIKVNTILRRPLKTKSEMNFKFLWPSQKTLTLLQHLKFSTLNFLRFFKYLQIGWIWSIFW